MNQLSRKFGMLVAAGLTCASGFAVTPEASAVDWDYTMHTDDGDPGGVVHFEPNGDYIQICDIEEDGWGVTTNVSDSSGTSYSLSVGGNGNCETVNASTHDLKEQVYIAVRVCLFRTGPLEDYCDSSSWWNG